MKAIKKSQLILVIALSLSAFLIGCDSSGDLSSTNGTEDGVQFKQDPEAELVTANWPFCDSSYYGELSDVETEGILFMREEE